MLVARMFCAHFIRGTMLVGGGFFPRQDVTCAPLKPATAVAKPLREGLIRSPGPLADGSYADWPMARRRRSTY